MDKDTSIKDLTEIINITKVDMNEKDKQLKELDLEGDLKQKELLQRQNLMMI